RGGGAAGGWRGRAARPREAGGGAGGDPAGARARRPRPQWRARGRARARPRPSARRRLEPHPRAVPAVVVGMFALARKSLHRSFPRKRESSLIILNLGPRFSRGRTEKCVWPTLVPAGVHPAKAGAGTNG